MIVINLQIQVFIESEERAFFFLRILGFIKRERSERYT